MRCPLARTFTHCRGFYRILGVHENANRDEIRKAYLKLAKVYHPDTPTGDTEKFKRIGEAWSVLGNEKSRALYDLNLGEKEEKNEEVRRKPEKYQDDYERFNIFQHDPVKSALFRKFVRIAFVRKIIEKYSLQWKYLIVLMFVGGIIFTVFDQNSLDDGQNRQSFSKSVEDHFREKRERKYFEDDND